MEHDIQKSNGKGNGVASKQIGVFGNVLSNCQTDELEQLKGRLRDVQRLVDLTAVLVVDLYKNQQETDRRLDALAKRFAMPVNQHGLFTDLHSQNSQPTSKKVKAKPR